MVQEPDEEYLLEWADDLLEPEPEPQRDMLQALMNEAFGELGISMRAYLHKLNQPLAAQFVLAMSYTMALVPYGAYPNYYSSNAPKNYRYFMANSNGGITKHSMAITGFSNKWVEAARDGDAILWMRDPDGGVRVPIAINGVKVDYGSIQLPVPDVSEILVYSVP